jgi:hypothetical protein
VRPRVVDGGDGLQTWTVVANILSKQSGTADKGWSCLRVEGLTNHHRKKSDYEMLHRASDFDVLKSETKKKKKRLLHTFSLALVGGAKLAT